MSTALLLDPRELNDLAGFFARRFPDPAARGALATSAGLASPVSDDAVADWAGVLLEAQRRGALSRLATAARSVGTTDPNLAEVCALLGARDSAARKSGRALPAAAAAALVALALGTGAWWAGQAPAESETAATAPEETVETVTLTSMVGRERPMTPQAEAVPARFDPVPETDAALFAPGATARTSHSGRCRGKPGEVVGYWYAGAASPGHAGDVVTVSPSVNVRADWPGTHNGHDRRAAVRCILADGDRVHLSRDPIAVPGDKYWVPLVAGDLLSD